MNKAHIIIIDDQSEVLSSLQNDLTTFSEKFIIDDCESAEEATELLEELDASGDKIAIILSDHLMPKKNGIDFLSELKEDDRFEDICKVLITGQASHKDTINAINHAAIQYYINKPWDKKDLIRICKIMITDWLIDNEMDYKDYNDFIDCDRLLQRLKKSNCYLE